MISPVKCISDSKEQYDLEREADRTYIILCTTCHIHIPPIQPPAGTQKCSRARVDPSDQVGGEDEEGARMTIPRTRKKSRKQKAAITVGNPKSNTHPSIMMASSLRRAFLKFRASQWPLVLSK
jgi:hypothetical protein